MERAYQSLYGQDMEEAEALLAGEETRARFGLDEQGAQQALGLLRAQAAQNRATQATIRQQEEKQLLNTVLNLAQGTQGQAADPVAACKAVQAAGLDPESKAQVLLALEQGRINTRDEPQRVNALAEAIIRGEERGTDTEMALTRAMAAGQLTHKSRERLTQLKAQLDGPYGPMLQHAYVGLAAQFAQDGSPHSAARQLAWQHLQAGFNQALTSNNVQELERLSHPDAVAAIAVRYWQPAQMQADYLEGFNPLEGPYLSAAQGGSRSDAGGYAAPEPEEQHNYDGMVSIEGSGAANTAELPLAAVHGGIKGLNAFLELLQAFPDDRESTATDYTKLFEGLYIADGMPLQRLDPLRIPNIPAPESAAGTMLAAATQFLLGFKGAEKVLAGMAAGTKGLSIGKSLGKAALSDFAFFDGQEERLSNLVQSVPALANPVNAFLAAAPDDRQAEGRLKNALEGLGMGVIAEGMVHGLGLTKFGRQLRDGAETPKPARTQIESVQEARRAALRDREPTVVLTGKEFSTTDLKELRKECMVWYKQNLAGKSGNHLKLGLFTFSAGVGKPLSKSADIRKLQLFPELRACVEKSEYVATSKSIKSKHSDFGMDYYYTRNTIQLGDELIDVGFVLRKDPHGQVYYDHMVHGMAAIKDAPWASPAVVVPFSPKGTSGPKGTRGSHPALHEASTNSIDSQEGQVNVFILGVRSLRGAGKEGKEKANEQ